MGSVWVQVWTAPVAGSVEIDESDLAKVQGLELIKKLIPMRVEIPRNQAVQNLLKAEEMVEVLEPWRD